MEPPLSTKKKRKKKESPPPESISVIEQAWQLFAILVVAVIVVTVSEKIIRWINDLNLPFCDSNSGSPVDCIPCPEHGICQGGQLECLSGFKKSGRKCIENSLIGKSAEKLAGLMRDHVCSINGQAACQGKGPVSLSENELLDVVQLDNSKLHGTNLRLARQRALDILPTLLNTTIQGVQVFGCPGHLVNSYKPISCRFREWCFSNLLKLLLLLPLASVLTSFIWKLWRSRKRKSRAEELYAEVCEALEAKAFGELQSNLGNETWIVASRLRDHLLRPSERKDRLLWMEVERLVQEDSRIELYPKIVKGESRIVWEWQMEGSLSPSSLRTRPRGVPGSSPVQVPKDFGKSPVKKEESYYSM